MTKYLLILQVCSFLTGECKPPVEMEQKYNSWYECAAAGQINGIKILLLNILIFIESSSKTGFLKMDRDT